MTRGVLKAAVSVAVVVDADGRISKHFGSAPYYLIVDIDIEDGTVKRRRKIPKVGHGQWYGRPNYQLEAGAGSTPVPGSGANMAQVSDRNEWCRGGRGGVHTGEGWKHDLMTNPIEGCAALIVGGMGIGAYEAMMAKGIKPVLVALDDVEEALATFVKGKLEGHIELLH